MTGRLQLSDYLAWGQLVLAVLAAGAGVVFALLTPDFSFGTASEAPFLLFGVTASVVGALVAVRQPGNAVGWIMAAAGCSAALTVGTGSYVDYRIARGSPDAFTEAMALLSVACTPIAFHLIVPFLFVFPDGRLPSRRWLWVAVPSMGLVIVSLLTWVVIPGPLTELGFEFDNPLGVGGAVGRAVQEIGDASRAGVAAAVLAAAVSMVFRYRAAGTEQRQQIKWMAYAGAVLVLAFIAGNLMTVIGSSTWDDAGPDTLVTIGMAAIPLAAGIAILRYNLYDIDRIINRTLVYGLLTAGLSAIYVGLIAGLQVPLRHISGGSDLAIVVTTLVVAALFLPARRRVQDAVDRRFNRRHYDAARTIDAFSARLREQIDLDTLRHELLAVVDDTMRPARASLWLVRRNDSGTP
ncbi:MAG: hypothetical protein ACRDJ9_15350 [Dehalococcoidia bacterium]